MDNLRNLFKKLAFSPDATNFYLDQTVFGLFYFEREHCNTVQADKRLLNFLNLGNQEDIFNPNQYLNDLSQERIKNLSKLKGQDINSQEHFYLVWEIGERIFQTQCSAYWLQSEDIVIVGLVETEELSEDTGKNYFKYIAENASEGIIVFENEALAYASPTYLEMMGHKMEEIIGKGAEWAFGDIHHEDRPAIIKIFEEIYEKQIPKKRYKFRARKSNGDYIWREDYTSFEFNEKGGIKRAVVVAKEISHQIVLEKELLKQEEIYRNLFDNVLIGLLITDKATTILEVNDAACTTIGLSRETLIGSKINDPSWELFGENYESLNIEETPVPVTAATGQAVAPVIIGYHKHDEPEKVKWVELSSSPVFNEKGEVDKITCTFLDVTEKHEADTRIKSTNEELILFKEFIECGTDGLQVSDKSGRMVYINSVSSQRLAINPEEVHNYNVIDFENLFETQEDWDNHFAELKNVGRMILQTENTNLTTRATFPAEINVRYACINDKEYTIASVRDITERKQAKESETKYQSVVSALNEGFVLQNADGSIIASNANAEKILGLSKDQMSGKTSLDPSWRSIRQDGSPFPGEEHPAMITLREGKPQQNVIMGVHKPDDSLTWISINTEPLFHEGQTLPYAVAASFTNITEKRNAESQLFLEKKRLDNIIDGVKLGTWEMDLKEGYVNFNTHWAEMLGYKLEEVSPGSVEIWSKMVHPDDLAKAEDAIQAHTNDETQTYDVEFRMRHKEGHWLWIESRGKIITRDNDNNPVLFSGTHNDISKRKEVENQLRLEKTRLDNIIDGVKLGTWEWNMQEDTYDLNSHWAEMIGYEREEVMPVSLNIWSSRVHPDDWLKTEKALQAHIDGKTDAYQAEFRMRHKAGYWVWIISKGKIIIRDKNDSPVLFSGTHSDISRRKEAETLLEQSEKQYRQLVENSNDIIYSLSPEGIFTFVSSAWERLLGYQLEEVVGSASSDFIHPEDVLTCATFLKKTLDSGERQKEIEYRVKHKDGHWVWHNTTASPQKDKNGNVIGLDGLARDITERKISEENLAKQSNIRTLLIELASEFINVPLVQVPNVINDALGKLGAFYMVDRAYVFEYDWQRMITQNTYEWCAEGISAEIDNLQEVPLEYLPNWLESHKQGKAIIISDTADDSVPEATKEILLAQGIKSLITFPMMMDENCIGFVGFDSVRQHKVYSKTEEDLLLIFSKMLVNISERQKYEQQLVNSEGNLLKAKNRAEESEQRFKLATDAARLGIWDWDIIGDNFIWDDKTYELFGHERDTKENTPYLWVATLHPEDKKRVLNEIEDTVKRNREYRTTYKIIKPSGEHAYLNSYGILIRDEDGKAIRMIGVVRDVTDEKTREIELSQAKEMAEESEQRFKLATDAAELGIWAWDMEKDEVFWDKKSYKLLGLTKGVDKPNFETWSKAVHPDDLENTVVELDDALKGKKEYNPTFRSVHPNGQEIYITGYGIVLRDSEGNPKRMIGVVRDVTEDKLKEIELTQAKEIAEAASVAKSEFLANMSHEIRTPLNSVIGFSELLMQTQLNDTQHDYMQSVNYSANTLLDLINDILDFSKIEAGKLDLEQERISLRELLYQTVEMVKFKLEEKDIELLLYIASDVPQYVFADAVRIRQILVNLMSNAVKFTKEGEIEMSLIKLEKTKNDNKVSLRFEVRDTGIGISEAKQQHIFEAFSQEDTSTTRSYGGTGLGLTISNQLLALMSSTMQLKSEQGKGSSFYFDVEFEYEKEALSDENNLEDISSILLVDDNERSLEIIKSLFDDSNIKLETATNGFEALGQVQANWQHYDVVLLDYKMPFIDGKDVAKQIKEKLKLTVQQLPLLMMFDTVNEEFCQELKDEYSVIGCLQKPFTKKELLRSIAALKNEPEEILAAQIAIPEQPSVVNFSGQSLLIVDDNSMNRKLANSMLRKLFKDVEIIEAENGEKALDLVKKYHFMMILMDIQMPGMSGYEVTRRIRELISDKDKTSIIALTAGTIKGEKERCVAAGMDDYMSKPVTLAKLKGMVAKWIDSEEEGKDELNRQGLDESNKLDFNYKAFLEALGNDTETAEEILDTMRGGELKEQIVALNEAFKEQGKEEQIRSFAHKIKGMCLNLYFEKLADVAGQLQDLFPNYSNTEAHLLLEQINERCQVLTKIINEKEYL